MEDLLGACVFGDCLGALTDGVLGQLSREKEADCGLYFAAGDGASLVVVGEAGSFGGDSFENVIYEGVHDAHGLGADSGVGVYLFEDLVDVDGIGFLPPLLLLFLVGLGDVFLGLSGLLGGFT